MLPLYWKKHTAKMALLTSGWHIWLLVGWRNCADWTETAFGTESARPSHMKYDSYRLFLGQLIYKFTKGSRKVNTILDWFLLFDPWLLLLSSQQWKATLEIIGWFLLKPKQLKTDQIKCLPGLLFGDNIRSFTEK